MLQREYLSAEQLAALTPWTVEAIRRMVSRGILRRGIDYFQPFGSRTQLLFKWRAIRRLIEGDHAPDREDEASGVLHSPTRGTQGVDASAVASALRGLLDAKNHARRGT